MTDYGVTSTGFTKKSLAVIRQEIRDDLLDAISTDLNLLDSSVLGQIEGVFSDKLREAWDVLEAVYRSFYPDSASEEALEGVCAISGVRRLASTKSQVTLDRIFLEDGVTVTVGSIVGVGANGPRFVVTAAVSNTTGRTATFSTTAEAQEYGAVQGYAETIDTIDTPIAGWSDAAAVSGSNQETFTLDGKALDLVVDEDGATQTVNFAAGDPWSAAAAAAEIVSQTTGIDSYDDGDGYVRVASATAGTGSAIEVQASAAATALGLPTGLVKGFNSTDADPGRELETDPDLRRRREAALRAAGSATVEAIRAALLLVDDVEQVVVFENLEAIPSGGLPQKSFEAVVLGGVNADIAETIWTEKPAGIKPWGAVSETVTDSMGFSHTIRFSRPTEIPIYLKYTLTTDSDYPSDGDDQVKAAAVALAAELTVGEDVIALQFEAAALEVAGVVDVTDFRIDTVDPPVATSNIAIADRSIATLDSGDITVV